MRRTITAGIVTLTAIAVLAAAPAAAHTQSVHPPGGGAGFTSGIARSWAQAHCNSAAPSVHADHPVVTFSPTEAKPCLATTLNPGGQAHPHSG